MTSSSLLASAQGAIPFGSLAGILGTFATALIFIILFSIYYVRKYSNPLETDRATTITAVLSLIVALLSCSLLPVDIFIVSSMKNADGSWKEWAANSTAREGFESDVLYAYYTLYSIIFAFVFFIIPFMYFYYEEKDSDLFNSNRALSALKYTAIFVLLAAFFLLIGAFVPLREIPNNDHGNSTNSNSSSWIDKFKSLVDILERNRGEDALSMVLSILSALGVTNVAIYTAIGLFNWPISFIKGTKSAAEQQADLEERHLNATFNINSLREKERTCGQLTEKERARLRRLEEQQRINSLEERYVDAYRSSRFYQFRVLLRPLQIAFGVAVLAISILMWASLLITNIDKAFHSLGMTMGYALPKATYPNPIDWLLVHLQGTTYPLDYALVILFAFVLVMYTISGYMSLGIRFFFFRIYKIVPSKTAPQAILTLFALLMATILGVNILFYSTFPQYVTYGNQHYLQTTVNQSTSSVEVAYLGMIGNGTVASTVASTTTMATTLANSSTTAKIASTLATTTMATTTTLAPGNVTSVLTRCTFAAPADACTMTRASALLVRFFYKAWFFGAYYYWAMWAFIAISFISFVYVTVKPKQAVTEGLLDEDDLEEDE